MRKYYHIITHEEDTNEQTVERKYIVEAPTMKKAKEHLEDSIVGDETIISLQNLSCDDYFVHPECD
jgi:hypothetical protein